MKIPYVSAPENACALACYTMVAQYFFPDTTFEEIAEVTGWEPGYVIWAFLFWLWIMDKGVRVQDYDLLAMEAWAEQGLAGLRESVSEKEYEYYKTHTKDLDAVTEDIGVVVNHDNFVHLQKKPGMEDLEQAFDQGDVCEVVLDSHTLDEIDGFALHRVVITDLDEKSIRFHDPREKSRPYRQEQHELFKNAWLEAVSEPELCVYSKMK